MGYNRRACQEKNPQPWPIYSSKNVSQCTPFYIVYCLMFVVRFPTSHAQLKSTESDSGSARVPAPEESTAMAHLLIKKCVSGGIFALRAHCVRTARYF